MKLEDIWQAYRSSLKAFLHSRLHNPSDVDDLLQEIMLKSHQKLSQLQSKDNIKAWLFQIAKHSLIDFYRKQGHQQTIEKAEPWLAEHPENDADKQIEQIKTKLSRCIEPFLSPLPQRSAELVRAIDLNGQSQKHYAKEQGLSYSTLKSQVQKARSAHRYCR
ncbi:sigma-70 family RNA polymerase sigma factor [Agaribacterium sp. ZY112]|uniref:sigma-70 family RNA polymerase sigma factor n=1 Tax=Agaribacterium sp. ZY112 TaxID=3233574 RepID=UPI0035267950